MCLAIPASIQAIEDGGLATVDILGVTRSISVDLTPQAKVGDYVLVHAGFAIEVVDQQFAEETLDLIREFPELAADEVGTATAPMASTMVQLAAALEADEAAKADV
uniref:HypC/HybG/HupF family hydrogenase formation chaperone n=1 Tax=Muribaculaceae bacterium Z82 TaxID=2304548 RepID=A0A7C9NS89_9BACT